MAGLGFFAMDMNAGWEEWKAAGLPVHEGAAQDGGMRCECSKGG